MDGESPVIEGELTEPTVTLVGRDIWLNFLVQTENEGIKEVRAKVSSADALDVAGGLQGWERQKRATAVESLPRPRGHECPEAGEVCTSSRCSTQGCAFQYGATA